MAMAKIGAIIEMVDLVGLISMEVEVQHVTREEATGTEQLLMTAQAEQGGLHHMIVIECLLLAHYQVNLVSTTCSVLCC